MIAGLIIIDFFGCAMDVFNITPVSSKPFWYLTAVCALMAVILFGIAYSAYGAYHSRVSVSDQYLHLSGGFFGRKIPLDQLETDKMRILDLSRDVEFIPKWRTMGVRVPGYTSGWFKLKNQQKALIFMTTQNQVAYIPTKMGFSVMTSVDQPQQLLDLLQAK